MTLPYGRMEFAGETIIYSLISSFLLSGQTVRGMIKKNCERSCPP